MTCTGRWLIALRCIMWSDYEYENVFQLLLLQRNNISSITTELQTLSNLTELDLSQNHFTQVHRWHQGPGNQQMWDSTVRKGSSSHLRSGPLDGFVFSEPAGDSLPGGEPHWGVGRLWFDEPDLFGRALHQPQQNLFHWTQGLCWAVQPATVTLECFWL